MTGVIMIFSYLNRYKIIISNKIRSKFQFLN